MPTSNRLNNTKKDNLTTKELSKLTGVSIEQLRIDERIANQQIKEGKIYDFEGLFERIDLRHEKLQSKI